MSQFAICLLIYFIICLAYADQNDALEIIDLNSRPAEEIIPIIKPVLKPNDSVAGTGFQIFLRTDSNTLSEVKRLLQVIDKASQNLIITVSNDINTHSEAIEADVSANYEITDDGRVIVGERPPRVEGLRIHANKDNNLQTNNFSHKVRVIDGNSAYISAGEVRPYNQTAIYENDKRITAYREIGYQDITSGFSVTPRLSGDNQVTLRIQPHYRHSEDSYENGISTQVADTVITVNLDQWVLIAGIDESANLKDTNIASVSRTSNQKSSAIYIKVEIE